MREIAAVEVNTVIREIRDKLSNSHIRKFYDMGDGAFRLGFYKNGKNVAIYCKLLKTINETEFSEDAEEASNFAMGIRKRIENARVTDFGQHGSDRIIIFTLIAGGQEYKLIFEMLGKGNVILVNELGVIETCYRSIQYKERMIEPHEVYQFPSSESVDFNLLDKGKIEAIIDGLKGKMRLITELSRSINIGPLYLEDIILRSEMDPKVESLDDRQRGKLKRELLAFMEAIKRPQPMVYRSNNEYVDYAILPIKKYEALETVRYPTLNVLLDNLYVKERIGTDEKKNEKANETKANIERQEKLAEELEKEFVYSSIVANRIFENMNEINALIRYIKEKRKVSVEELSDMFKGIKVKVIDFKDKSVIIEIEE